MLCVTIRDVEALFTFLGISAVVIVTPGQDTALTIRNTLVGGRRSGIATAAGVALGQAAWTIAASAGAVALLQASGPAFVALRFAGAAYLIWLGLHAIVAAIRGRRRDHGAAARELAPRRALRQGLLSNLGNPKMAIFFTSLLPQFASTFAGLLALGLVFCSLTFVWLTVYALVLARTGDALRRPLDAFMGVTLVALGIRVAAERR
jgi:threonine/homoserine/homoserine lactone efflux protein